MFLVMMTAPRKNKNYPIYVWEWRKAKGMTSARLAEAADMQQSALSAIETGSRRANVDHLVALAEVLKIHPGHLFRDPNDIAFRFEALIDQLPDSQLDQALQVLETFVKPSAPRT